MQSKEQLNLMGRLDANGDAAGRPQTPEVIINENREEEMRKPHVVLIQKIARGRTIQKLVLTFTFHH